MDMALQIMKEKAEIRMLLNKMVHHRQFAIDEGVEATTKAAEKGVMKVQIKI